MRSEGDRPRGKRVNARARAAEDLRAVVAMTMCADCVLLIVALRTLFVGPVKSHFNLRVGDKFGLARRRINCAAHQ